MMLYLFSILTVPKWVLKEIKKLQRFFLWGNSGQNRKWALVKWDKVCLPKHPGGTGLRDPYHSNAVMEHAFGGTSSQHCTLLGPLYGQQNMPITDLLRILSDSLI